MRRDRQGERRPARQRHGREHSTPIGTSVLVSICDTAGSDAAADRAESPRPGVFYTTGVETLPITFGPKSGRL